MTAERFKYYEGFIKKKEGRSKWTEYWAVVHGTWILFYTESTTLNRDNFRGSLELTRGTKCTVGKRRAYSFPFYISTARGTHLFKCPNNLKRHQWMYVIALAIRGDPPTPPPLYIPSHQAEVATQEKQAVQQEECDGRESEDESDTDSLPPGVVLVTELPDEMSRNKKEQNLANDPAPASVLAGITLTTNISGNTHIGSQTSTKGHSAESTSCLLAPTLGPSTNSRPKSTPSSGRAVNGLLSPKSGSLLFSRHMGRSSPNVKIFAAYGFT